MFFRFFWGGVVRGTVANKFTYRTNLSQSDLLVDHDTTVYK